MFPYVTRECQSQNSIHVPQSKNRDTTTQVSTASAVFFDNIDKISTPVLPFAIRLSWQMNYKSSISTSLSATTSRFLWFSTTRNKETVTLERGVWLVSRLRSVTDFCLALSWRCHYMDIDERAAHVEHKGHWWNGLRETDSNQIESDMRREGIHRLDPTHYTNLLPYSRAESRTVNRVHILCTHASQMHISISTWLKRSASALLELNCRCVCPVDIHIGNQQ